MLMSFATKTKKRKDERQLNFISQCDVLCDIDPSDIQRSSSCSASVIRYSDLSRPDNTFTREQINDATSLHSAQARTSRSDHNTERQSDGDDQPADVRTSHLD